MLGGNGDDSLYDLAGVNSLDAGPGHDTINGVREDGAPTNGPIRYADYDRTVYVEGTDGVDVVRVSDVTTAQGRFVRVDANRNGTAWLVDFPFSIVDRISIDGYGGNDRVDLSGVPVPAAIWGSDGDDTIIGGEAADNLDGGEGNDRLYGGSGNDTLTGGGGKDQLRGQAGNDTLFADGDREVDFLDGGSGTDKAKKDNNDFAQFVEQFLA